VECASSNKRLGLDFGGDPNF